jgi:hypothetical protein
LHAQKLIWFPGQSGVIEADIDWDWISGLERLQIGEMRIDEQINGQNNIRLIFFKADQSIHGETLPRIWIYRCFSKEASGLRQAAGYV